MYAFQDTFLPRLRAVAVSEPDLTTVTVENPRRVLVLSGSRPACQVAGVTEPHFKAPAEIACTRYLWNTM